MEKSSLSTPELVVANWLTKHDILFKTQERFFGGVTQIGGAIADFVLPLHNIIIRVQSYWHQESETVARDALQKINLMAEGWIVVDCWEEDLERNLDYVMERAVQGMEV